MARTAGRAARFFTVKNVTLRRETIVIALALLLLAAAIPFAWNPRDIRIHGDLSTTMTIIM